MPIIHKKGKGLGSVLGRGKPCVSLAVSKEYARLAKNRCLFRLGVLEQKTQEGTGTVGMSA